MGKEQVDFVFRLLQKARNKRVDAIAKAKLGSSAHLAAVFRRDAIDEACDSLLGDRIFEPLSPSIPAPSEQP